jgi:hypothetical protein
MPGMKKLRSAAMPGSLILPPLDDTMPLLEEVLNNTSIHRGVIGGDWKSSVDHVAEGIV